ncbi:hypothetical protein T265_08773 [Opisthorchis viverrini]|uniref:Trematode PH-like domain-containing protein n=1 Tax=Opisthorchis viverrini TaxID=6198 RepID=A0A074Z892_OPIVI|nr:hypothetical protein T265_08773 [Opisthorchis viverrini]KER23328.1 hypothetical protein T265_08773 [Opisthorchis viverrini]
MPEPRIKSKRSSSLYNGSSLEHTVYYECTARLVAQKKLKADESFSQDGVEQFIKKSGKSTMANYALCFLRDRIVFKSNKVGVKSASHEPVLYTQIKGGFSVSNFPNMLILGIDYPAQSKRRYESFVFPTVSSANVVKEILLDVRKQPDGILHRSSVSQNTASISGRSLPRLSMPEYVFQASTPLEVAPTVYTSEEVASEEKKPSKSEETIPQNVRVSHALNSPIKSTCTENEPNFDYPRCVENPVTRSDRKISDSYRYKAYRSHPELAQVTQARFSDYRFYSRNRCEVNPRTSVLLDAIRQENREDVLFLNSNECTGTQIADDGPIYMICKREPSRLL